MRVWEAGENGREIREGTKDEGGKWGVGGVKWEMVTPPFHP